MTHTLARQIVQSVTGIPLPPRDQITPDLADELVQVLGEAATELWNIDPQHVTLARLRAVRRRVEQSERT